MKTITLPGHDVDGQLTPLVIAAMEAGATSSHDAENPDNIIISFKTERDADAFRKRLPKPIIGDEPTAVNDIEASD